MKTIAVLVGSNRKQSINLKFARALGKLAQGKLDFRYADLGAMPMFNDDLVADLPQSVRAMKDLVAQADGVLLVTPEHNRTFTALLKSAIDWGTRPYGENSWNGKPGAIVGASPGAIGTMAAQVHLRSVMSGLGLIVMGQPEMLIQLPPDLIDDDFNVTNDKTREFFQGFIDRFDAWIERTAA